MVLPAAEEKKLKGANKKLAMDYEVGADCTVLPAFSTKAQAKTVLCYQAGLASTALQAQQYKQTVPVVLTGGTPTSTFCTRSSAKQLRTTQPPTWVIPYIHDFDWGPRGIKCVFSTAVPRRRTLAGNGD
eukprot:2263913-Rhodomonas_salina.2